MDDSVSFHSTEKSKQQDPYKYLQVSSARKLFLPRTGTNGPAFHFGLANTLYLAVAFLVILLFITLFVLCLFLESSALY